MKPDLQACLERIKAPDTSMEAKARQYSDTLAKPPGSLGLLEDTAARLAGIQGREFPEIRKKNLLVFCADNGVVEEGVSSAPQSITHAQTLNLVRGITGAAVLAKHFGSELTVVDVGVKGTFIDPRIIDRKIRSSTGNIRTEHAMTREEAERAVLAGIETATEAVKNGADLLGVGEMGIGNTTTSAAVLHVLTGAPVSSCAGKGAGLDMESYRKKLSVIEETVRRHRPNREDPIDVIAKVGGLDIAAMAGAFLGAAACGCPVVIDGFISAVAALAAVRLNPLCRPYLFASHHSKEPGYRVVIEALELEAGLQFGMRLGEGSGCPLMFTVMEAACAVHREMGTFETANIDTAYLDKLDGDSFTL